MFQINSELAGVVKVFPNRFYKLHTTQSNNFLYGDLSNPGMPVAAPTDLISNKLGNDDIIIGILDSGN